MTRVIAFVCLFCIAMCAQAQVTCTSLDGAYVIGQDSGNTYLGFFGTEYATESIMNPFGSHGSEFGNASVRNTFGAFGSSFGPFSAKNALSSSPPMIAKRGNFIAFLTTNSSLTPRVSLTDIGANCDFFSSSADRRTGDPIPQPPAAGGGTPQPPATGMGGLDISLMGTWWNPNRSGEGVMVDLANSFNPQLQGAFVAWYTYDNEGFPLFITGYSDYDALSDTEFSYDAMITYGPVFGPDYDPADLQVTVVGQVRMQFLNCDQARLTFTSVQPWLTDVTLELTRFLPRQTGHTCP